MPNFKTWSIERLRAEAKRLAMPMYSKKSKAELIELLTDAYS